MKNIFYLLLLPSFLFYGCKKEDVPFNGPGSVSGTVFEYGTTVPVSGAWVYLITTSYDSYPNVVKVIKAIQTDSSGSYIINYDWETGKNYQVSVKYTGTTKIYGYSIPEVGYVSKKVQNGADFGLTTTAYFTLRMIDTGFSSPLEYFDIFGMKKVYNITKDTLVVGSVPANLNHYFVYQYQYVNSTQRLDYFPKPPPFYAAKEDTLHYTVYF